MQKTARFRAVFLFNRQRQNAYVISLFSPGGPDRIRRSHYRSHHLNAIGFSHRSYGQTGTPKTVTAGAGGIEFGEISYTSVGGPYVYTFTEKAGSNARWTYDDSVYTMTVNVIRNAEDKLEA